MTQGLEWKLWYGDGSTFSNLNGTPADAPAYNVQCIVQWEEVWGELKPMHRTGVDNYIYCSDDERWHFHDDKIASKFIAEHPFACAIKYGCEIPLMQYNRIVDGAREEAKGWTRE